jgi:hypothetical protein
MHLVRTPTFAQFDNGQDIPWCSFFNFKHLWDIFVRNTYKYSKYEDRVRHSWCEIWFIRRWEAGQNQEKAAENENVPAKAVAAMANYYNQIGSIFLFLDLQAAYRKGD